jgi:hypothetical protein
LLLRRATRVITHGRPRRDYSPGVARYVQLGFIDAAEVEAIASSLHAP